MPDAVSVPGEPKGAPVKDSMAVPIETVPPGAGVGSIPAYVQPLPLAALIAAQGSAGLTPEEQAILTEAERARLMSMEDDAAAGNAPAPSVKDGYYPPIMLPPTRYSPPEVRDAVGGGPPNPSSLTP